MSNGFESIGRVRKELEAVAASVKLLGKCVDGYWEAVKFEDGAAQKTTLETLRSVAGGACLNIEALTSEIERAYRGLGNRSGQLAFGEVESDE